MGATQPREDTTHRGARQSPRTSLTSSTKEASAKGSKGIPSEVEDRVPPLGDMAVRVNAAGIRMQGRAYSVRSEEALNALLHTDCRLKTIEDRVAILEVNIKTAGSHPNGVSKAKIELAQLEADAHKLESAGVDNIYTGELESGKAPAKESKKEQLRRLEALFNRIDDIFRAISRQAEASNVPDTSLPALPPPEPPACLEECE